MTRSIEELPRRRPVWQTMSAVFLDTEIDEAQRDDIVTTLLASGYSDGELDDILWNELCPVLHANLQSVAGEWAGFDMERVEERILNRPAGVLRCWWAFLNGGYLARRAWREIMNELAERRETIERHEEA